MNCLIKKFSYLTKIYQKQNIRVDMEYETLYEFFKKRIEILFEESGFNSGVIKASFMDNMCSDVNPHLIFLKVNKLQKFLNKRMEFLFYRHSRD